MERLRLSVRQFPVVSHAHIRPHFSLASAFAALHVATSALASDWHANGALAVCLSVYVEASLCTTRPTKVAYGGSVSEERNGSRRDG